MPEPVTCWWHLILTARGQWLPGDPRGFRSRKHRVHSGGDYKTRPPAGEHEGLYRYHRNRAAVAITFPAAIRRRLGEALCRKIEREGLTCLCLAAGPTHAHLLVRAATDYNAVTKTAGRLKQAASHAVRDAVPGKLWAGGGKPIRVKDRGHQLEVFRYILDHADEGAWVWRFDENSGD